MGMSDESNTFNKTLGSLWGYGNAIYKTETLSVLQNVSKANLGMYQGTGSQFAPTTWRAIYRLT